MQLGLNYWALHILDSGFWIVLLCHWVSVSGHFEGLQCLQVPSKMVIQSSEMSLSLIEQHGTVSQRTWVFSTTTARTSNFACCWVWQDRKHILSHFCKLVLLTGYTRVNIQSDSYSMPASIMLVILEWISEANKMLQKCCLFMPACARIIGHIMKL